ncbi:MAG: hypothetical protein KGL90_02050 [Burkholderiales bacterium]|nr:hypothetical protein [Burkholderiales bacterium]
MFATAVPQKHTNFPPPILDVEASGFGLGSYPIEVGIVMPDGSAWCSLVRPEPQWEHWDPNAAALHHITREQLLSHGRPAGEVADALNERLHGQLVYSDAWAHDYTWLSRLFAAAGKSQHFKLDSVRTLLSDAEAAAWHEVKNRVALGMTLERHRASSDARLLRSTLLALRQPLAAVQG